ncbi:MAG: ATP-binding protein [Planctomycetota bacterium]
MPSVPERALSVPERALSLVAPVRLGSSVWLMRLRWFAVVGQCLTIFITWATVPIILPYRFLGGMIGVTVVTNVVYHAWLSRHRESEPDRRQPSDSGIALALMLLDLITLTAMLHATGGVENPFSFFFFVNLAVGGVMIAAPACWTLTIAAVCGYAWLLTFAPPLPLFIEGETPAGTVRFVARIAAFATCASVVTYFVSRTANESLRYYQQLMRLQEDQEAGRRLEGLTTLAAGAAHELATPLSTIDIVARELSRHLSSTDVPESVEQDLRLIDDELERCRQILGRMRAAAGDSVGEPMRRTTLGDLIDATIEGVRDPHRLDVIDEAEHIEATELLVPTEAVAQAVRNLIHNALDASGGGRVQLQTHVDERQVRFIVSDYGDGMSAEVLGRISEPFFTTKEPGRGIGLGLFLTRNVVQQLGWRLNFESQVGKGTVATVELPRGS